MRRDSRFAHSLAFGCVPASRTHIRISADAKASVLACRSKISADALASVVGMSIKINRRPLERVARFDDLSSGDCGVFALQPFVVLGHANSFKRPFVTNGEPKHCKQTEQTDQRSYGTL